MHIALTRDGFFTIEKLLIAPKPQHQLEVSPRLTREASAFWKAIREEQSMDKRDGLWAGILPTAEDLKNPSAFISSTEIPDDLSGLL